MITGRIGAILNGYRWDGTFEEVVESMLWWQDRCWRGIQAGAEAGIAGDQLLRDDGVVAGIQDQYEGTKRHLLAR